MEKRLEQPSLGLQNYGGGELKLCRQVRVSVSRVGGLHEFSVMPFGLVNAPSTFQRLMKAVLAGLSGEKFIVYIDDILVPGATWEEHLYNLREVFERLRSANLKLKSKKCSFAEHEVEYVISRDGLSTDPRKIRAVSEFSTPQDVKTLGLASYYRRFVPRNKRVQFDWTESCQSALLTKDHFSSLVLPWE